MRRINVIGTSCAGKTTFAASFAAAMGIAARGDPMRKLSLWIVAAILGWLAAGACAAEAGRMMEMPADVLRDKIRGGMLGQILGNLNGIPHEFKYGEIGRAHV